MELGKFQSLNLLVHLLIMFFLTDTVKCVYRRGSSKEVYIEQTTIQIIKRGWKVVVLNYSTVSIGNEGSVAGGNCLTDSHDINLLVSHLRNKYPQRKFLFCIGFSMGGAKLAQYLIRTGEACDLDGACTVSSPLDFTRDNDTGKLKEFFHHLNSTSTLTYIFLFIQST